MSRAGPRYDRGEIGQLAFAFDQMANALAEKEAQIREYTGELERKVRGTNKGASGIRGEISNRRPECK